MKPCDSLDATRATHIADEKMEMKSWYDRHNLKTTDVSTGTKTAPLECFEQVRHHDVSYNIVVTLDNLRSLDFERDGIRDGSPI